MKKIFLFAAAVVAAMTINAEVYDFSKIAAQTDYTISNATLNETESSASKFVYDVAAETELNFVPTLASDFTFLYKNTDAKQKAFIVNAGNSIEFGGKNGRIEIANLIAGDKLHLLVAAKGSSAASISVVNGAGEAIGEVLSLPKKDKAAEGADEQGYVYKDWEISVTADMIISGKVTIKETVAGFRIKMATLNENLPQGIENAEVAPKAEKFFRNGQLIIRKNGVEYNALGAQL